MHDFLHTIHVFCYLLSSESEYYIRLLVKIYSKITYKEVLCNLYRQL